MSYILMLPDLSLLLIVAEMLGPDDRYQRMAFWTAALCRRQSVLDHVEALALDDGFVARWAVRMLPLANPSRQISRVDVVQACFRPDLGGADQRIDSGWRRVDHAV